MKRHRRIGQYDFSIGSVTTFDPSDIARAPSGTSGNGPIDTIDPRIPTSSTIATARGRGATRTNSTSTIAAITTSGSGAGTRTAATTFACRMVSTGTPIATGELRTSITHS